MLIQHTSLQSMQGLICLANPGVDLFFEGVIIGNDTFEVLELLQPPVEMYVWMAVCCVRGRLEQHFLFLNMYI